MSKLVIEIRRPSARSSRSRIAGHVPDGGLDSVIFLVPTRRKAAQLREILAEGRGGILLGEVVLTVDELVKKFAPLASSGVLLNDAKRRVLVENAMDDGGVGKIFDLAGRFPGIAGAVSGLIAEMKQSGINNSGILRDALKRLYGASHHEKYKSIVSIYMKYESKLVPRGNRQGKRFLDSEDLPLMVSEFIQKNGISRVFKGRETIVWDGFYDFNMVQKKLVLALANSVSESVFMITLPSGSREKAIRQKGACRLPLETIEFLESSGLDVEINELHDADYMRPNAGINMFASRADYQENSCGEPLGIIEARDRVDEVRRIAEDIKKRFVDGDAIDMESTAVVFPALEKYQQYINQWFPLYGIPFQISAGSSLASSPVTSMFLAMLDTAENEFPRPAVYEFLTSPFVSFVNVHPELARNYPEVNTQDGSFWFDPAGFDTESRASGVSGGAQGSGPDVWIENIEETTNEIKKDLENLKTSDAYYENNQEKMRFKIRKRNFYQDAFKVIARQFSLISGKEKIDLNKYFQALQDVLDFFNVKWNTFDGGGGWEGVAGHAANSVALSRILDVMDECRSALALVVDGTGLTPAVYNSYIRAALQGETYHGKSAGSGVSVMGLYEVRGLDLESVYLGGLLQGEVPRGGDSPFLLNGSDRERLGMSSIRSDPSEQKMIFHQLVSSVRDLTISYPMWESGAETLVSSFLEDLKPLCDLNNKTPDEAHLFTQRHLHQQVGKVLLDSGDNNAAIKLLTAAATITEKSPLNNVLNACRAQEARSGAAMTKWDGVIGGKQLNAILVNKFLDGKHSFSATQLELYARCPFKYFCSRYVLDLDAPEEVELDVSPLDAGTIVHDVLCEFYSQRTKNGSTKRVTPDNFNDAVTQMREIASRVLSRDRGEGIFHEQFSDSLLRGLDGVLTDEMPGVFYSFLERERRLPSIIRPWLFEKNFPDEDLEWTCDVGNLKAFFRGSIDRVDYAQSATGKEMIVIDYKTGTGRRRIKDTFMGLDFQIPLYMLFLSKLMQPGDSYGGGAYDYLGGPYNNRGRKITLFASNDRVSKKEEDDVLFVSGSRSGVVDRQEFDDRVKGFEKKVREIIISLVNGNFHTSGLSDLLAGCKYCDFSGICRRNEQKSASWYDAVESGNTKGKVYIPRDDYGDNADTDSEGDS